MQCVEVTELSFFELDKLFTRSAKLLKRKLRKRRQSEKEGHDCEAESGDDRSDSPPTRKALRGSKVAHNFGGFTGAVEKVERTVIAVGVPAGADEKMLFKFFSRCGIVQDIRVVRNRHDVATGTVLCEFEQDESLNRAVALPPPFNEVLGVTLKIQRADAQLPKTDNQPKRMMTRQQFTQQVLSGLKAGAVNETGPNMKKLHIKNLRPVVTEEDMRGIFKPFGEFETFEMGAQECWITFKSHTDAQDAMSSMQGFQLVGQSLNIEVMPGPAPPELPKPAAPAAPPPPENMDLKSDSDFGATGQGDAVANRIELMKKLMTSHQQGGIPTVVGNAPPSGGGPIPPPPPGPPPAGAAANAVAPPTPKPGGPASRTLLLQNMFSPLSVNLEKEPRFYEEMREDTHDECMKFGKVLHVTVDPRGATGLIYVLYETPSQRQAAEMALNGRWFEGKKILAMGIEDAIWQSLAAQVHTQPQATTS